jgi:hypothetical protein
MAPSNLALGRRVSFTLAFGAELETLLVQHLAAPVIQRGSALSIEQHCVAMARAQGRQERDVVAKPACRLLGDVVRWQCAVDFVENSKPVIVQGQIGRYVQ